MQIKREDFFYFIKTLTGDSASIYLHGIADKSDNKTQWDDLSKLEKAQNICSNGLFISGNRRLAYTALCFGNLEDVYDYEKKGISQFNNYKYYSHNGEYITIIVAFPIIFEKQDGRKLFNGWDKFCSSSCENRESYSQSITYFLQQGKIQPEFILGYTIGSKDSDIVEFVENERYYSKLSIKEKDVFIGDFFEKNNACVDLGQEDSIKQQISNLDLSKENKLKIYEQIQMYQSFEYSKTIEKRRLRRNYYEINNPYTDEELENMSVEQIDISRVKPNADRVINGRYKITGNMLKANPRAGIPVSLMESVGFHLEETSWTLYKDFEKFVESKGNNMNALYRTWYLMYKHEYDSMYIQNLEERIRDEKRRKEQGNINRSIN